MGLGLKSISDEVFKLVLWLASRVNIPVPVIILFMLINVFVVVCVYVETIVK